MSTDRRIEIERCLSAELRMEHDEEGRLERAETSTGTLRVDWRAGTAKVSNQYGCSSWSAGVSQDDWSYGTWEKSSSTECSLAEFIDSAMKVLRIGLMANAGAEVEARCRKWLAYGVEHGVEIGSMRLHLLELYLASISVHHPEDLVAFARLINRESWTKLWSKILRCIDEFPPKQRRQIQQELGLLPPKAP